MKAKILNAVIMSAVLMSGCGSAAASEPSTPASSTAVTLDDTSALVDGNVISLNENMGDVKKKVGKETQMTETESCVYNGKEKIYEYDQFTIKTYPKDNEDYVSSITINSKHDKVSGNVQVGSQTSEIESEYPNAEKTPSVYILDQNDYGRSYSYADSTVTSIELYVIVQ